MTTTSLSDAIKHTNWNKCNYLTKKKEKKNVPEFAINVLRMHVTPTDFIFDSNSFTARRSETRCSLAVNGSRIELFSQDDMHISGWKIVFQNRSLFSSGVVHSDGKWKLTSSLASFVYTKKKMFI